jgi:hypothetical protein
MVMANHQTKTSKILILTMMMEMGAIMMTRCRHSQPANLAKSNNFDSIRNRVVKQGQAAATALQTHSKRLGILY